jgi:YVTN family beta-propeller protein
MTKKYLFFIAALLLLAASCKKDEPPEPDNGTIISSGNNGVYIINEGNFQFGNAAVSYYADGMANAALDLFQPANNRPLGDVCQSMYVFNNKAYIVVNNSGKVEVVNPNTFVSIATITGFNSPRYFLPVSNSKAYITDLYSNNISIADLSSNTVTGTIPCAGWTEELALAYGKVFVTNELHDKLYVINSLNDVLTDSITIGYGSNSIVEDKNGKLWVLCSGKQSSNINASLHRINPVNNTIESSYTFINSADSPWRLDLNGTHDTLYFLNNGCYRMAVTDNTLPSSAFISQNGRNFYGLGINPHNGNIYITDAIDYVQRGKIYIYKPDGNLVTSFLAGIIP